MSLWQRFRAALNTFTGNYDKMGFPIDIGASTSSGEAVGPESAKGLSTYFACIRNGAEDIAKLPLVVYERTENGGKKRAQNNPIYTLLDETPNGEMGAMTFRETLQGWAFAAGNGYAEIQRSGSGAPIALWPIHWSRVTVERANEELVYKIRNDNGTQTILTQFEIFHIRGVGDGPVGWSVLRCASESIGLGLAAQKYGASFFGKGAAIKGVLSHPMQLSPEAGQRLRDSWRKTYAGPGAEQVAILEEGMKFEKLGAPPEEAQFLETREFQVEDICRWFRMPPNKVGHFKRAQGWTSLELSNTDYVVDTLFPWCRRWEEEIQRKLFTASERSRFFAEHLFEGLLRGDAAARAAFYKAMQEMGAMNSNEIRARENLEPHKEGNTYFISANLKTFDMMKAEAAPVATMTANVSQPIVVEDSAVVALKRRMAEEAARRVLAKEQKAIERASKKADFATWAEEFYREQASYQREAFTPITANVESLDAWCQLSAGIRKAWVVMNVNSIDWGALQTELVQGFFDNEVSHAQS